MAWHLVKHKNNSTFTVQYETSLYVEQRVLFDLSFGGIESS
jgi:hypothetical protein